MNNTLGRAEIQYKLNGMFQTYPCNWKENFNYNLEYGPCTVYSDERTINELSSFLGDTGLNKEVATAIAKDVVNEGGIIIAETEMVDPICDIQHRLSSLCPEAMFFIQFLTTTGWNLSGFGTFGVYFGATTFILVKCSSLSAIKKLNETIKELTTTNNDLFGVDISNHIFHGLLP